MFFSIDAIFCRFLFIYIYYFLFFLIAIFSCENRQKLRTLKKHFTTLKHNCYEFRTSIKTLLTNIYDFVKFLTNFKKQTACLKQNFIPYFTMLKRNLTKS